MSKYSKLNIVYLLQKWMDSVPGQTFLNYAYSWGAAVVILGTLFKLTHLPGANAMLFIGMGTEVVVFFISAFDRPFDKSTIDMTLDNHVGDSIIDPEAQPAVAVAPAVQGGQSVIIGNGTPAATSSSNVLVAEENAGIQGTIIIGGGNIGGGSIGGSNVGGENISGGTVAPAYSSANAKAVSGNAAVSTSTSAPAAVANDTEETATESITFNEKPIGSPAPAVTPETARRMEIVTTDYIDHLNELNELLEKVAAQSARLATDSEEMENLNRTLTGISRVYEMQLKSASQQITTQDEINTQTKKMAEQIQELNAIYTRMIEAMTVNMPKMS